MLVIVIVCVVTLTLSTHPPLASHSFLHPFFLLPQRPRGERRDGVGDKEGKEGGKEGGKGSTESGGMQMTHRVEGVGRAEGRPRGQ
jgi:hypothetical protein